MCNEIILNKINIFCLILSNITSAIYVYPIFLLEIFTKEFQRNNTSYSGFYLGVN